MKNFYNRLVLIVAMLTVLLLNSGCVIVSWGLGEWWTHHDRSVAIIDPTPAHIFTNGLSLYLLCGSDMTSNAVYVYDAPRCVWRPNGGVYAVI